MQEREREEPEDERERTQVDDLEVDPEEAAKVKGGALETSSTTGATARKKLNTAGMIPCI